MARLVNLAHDMWEREEIGMVTYRAICTGVAAPCEDEACPSCYWQPKAGQP